MSKRLQALVIPVTAVILGLICGAIIMLIFGYDPIAGYSALIEGVIGENFYIGETIRQATPYILVGLSVAVAFKAGLFNIGAEGQMLMGWLGSIIIAVNFDGLTKWIHLPLAIITGMVFGALWAFIPGILKATLRVNEVIVTIMLNYTALYIFNYVVQNLLTDGLDKTQEIHASASLQSELLQSLTDYSSLHWGILIALGFALI
ncbi:ABC transporter permease, partial [Listeria monocytogenes]|nr:ABC transporter permease [Listeria monocytogenes]